MRKLGFVVVEKLLPNQVSFAEKNTLITSICTGKCKKRVQRNGETATFPNSENAKHLFRLLCLKGVNF